MFDQATIPSKLHHVGFLVRNIDSAVTQFTQLLGYTVESPLIEDPVQTAFVQFLRQPGAGHWLELICPNSEHSKLSNSLRKGGGLNHLCYEVDDIEAAYTSLHQRGLVLLAAPTPAVAFPSRRIAWLMGKDNLLVELVEAGYGQLSLSALEEQHYE